MKPASATFGAGAGRRVDYQVACVFESDGDRLVGERIYYDVATILRQIAALQLL